MGTECCCCPPDPLSEGESDPLLAHELRTENSKLKEVRDSQQRKIEGLERENKRLKAHRVTLQNADNNHDHDNDDELHGLHDHEREEYEKMIAELREDLSLAQKTILEMTNTVGVSQSLPTTKECIDSFHNIRNQQHHDTSSAIKVRMKYIFLI